MKRILVILLLAAAVGLASVAGVWAVGLREGGPAAGYETMVAQRGEITAKVNATGSIAPRNRVALNFPTPGRITEINASVGERVRAGQVLAATDARELQQAVAQAEAMLRMSEARLSAAQASVLSEDVAAARANLASAQENLNRLKAGPAARELEMARLRWEQAKDQLWSAQAQRDATCGNPSAPGYLKDQTRAAVASAEMGAEIARLQYEQAQEGPGAADLRAAEAQVAQAQANLARLTSEAAAAEISIAQAQVEQNAAALQQAKLRLENATLKAPFDGIVAACSGRVGEVSSVTDSVITLVDLSAYRIDVDIDESSIGQVKLGQKAEIILDAFPEHQLAGQVTHIDPVGTLSQGLVSYRVTVQLDPTEVPLKADMTATVNIITAYKADAILVPTRAVRRDREGRFVEVLVDGKVRRQAVEIGLSSDTETEITRGLNEGARVIISAPRQSPFTSSLLGGR